MKSIIISAVLILYCGICGFVSSAVRATVMLIVLCLTNAIGQKGDAINALSLAFMLICAIFPTEVFGVGLLLSFGISFSLVVLLPVFKPKSLTNDKTASVLSATVASELTAMPICVNAFGYFPLISFATNIFLVPAVSILYYLIWIGFIFSLILPFFNGIAMFLPDFLLGGLERLTGYISFVSLNIDFMPVLILVIYYFSLFVLSDFINAGKTVKRGALITVLFCVLISVIFSLIYK